MLIVEQGAETERVGGPGQEGADSLDNLECAGEGSSRQCEDEDMDDTLSQLSDISLEPGQEEPFSTYICSLSSVLFFLMLWRALE